MLGIGSVVDAGTSALYLQLGANFIVSPILNPEMAIVCNRRKVLWSPGCGTLTEISRAHELGAEVVKIFPGSQVGGPGFVKAIKRPCPWASIMPTGGVAPTEENLRPWFEAGVTCVGMGSKLFPRDLIAKQAFGELEGIVKDAMDLFGNMNFPASIIAGAIIPLGYVAPLSIESEPGDSIWEKRARRMYQVLSVVTLTTELLAVMWATVAANQLTENTFLPANSVWHLIRRDFELEWAAVNAHFVVGMFGFLGMIGTRAYFIAKRGALGKSSLGVALSGLALMVSIVNRGVAAGGGTTGMRFGGTVLALGKRYATLLVSRAFSLKTFGILECVSVTALVVSLGVAVKEAWQVDVEE